MQSSCEKPTEKTTISRYIIAEMIGDFRFHIMENNNAIKMLAIFQP